MSETTSLLGQRGTFLYKLKGKHVVVEAFIVDVRGARVEIEFWHPQRGSWHRRWLCSRADRIRFMIGVERLG